VSFSPLFSSEKEIAIGRSTAHKSLGGSSVLSEDVNDFVRVLPNFFKLKNVAVGLSLRDSVISERFSPFS